MGARIAILHGPPFLGRLGARHAVPSIHWEHGLVFPEVLAPTHAARAAREVERRTLQARKARVVACPSRSLAERLGLEHARVVPNGADHLPVPHVERSPSDRRLLAVLRTGTVEDQYKGLPDLLELPAKLGPLHPWTLDVAVTGPGSADAPLRAAGWTVHRDIAPRALARLYAQASAYIAPSRCESFDLPLVEAQRAGAAGLAFSAGAHAETCPHPYGSAAEAAEILARWDREGLQEARERSRRHAAGFTWERHGQILTSLVRELDLQENVRGAACGANAAAWRLWWSFGSGAYRLGRRWLR
jgi:glycosyltransferase involved in cell wall biosynthesis